MYSIITQPKRVATLFSFLASLILCQSSFAQADIHGKAINHRSEPIADVTFLLVRAADSTLIKSAIANKKGEYFFNNIPYGNYILSVSHLGYQTAYSKAFAADKENHAVTVADIVMQEETTSLKEVTVITKKPLLEQTIDRLIINVQNNITSAGNTALEVLERSPGVTVDHQNNLISINGKNGVVVMMNGKISHMPLNAVVQMLAGISSDNIEKIEIITTPPANLDAEGNAGYINIVLKENNNFGTNGSYAATIGYGKSWLTEASLNINHRKGKMNVYGDVSYSRQRKPFQVNSYNASHYLETYTETFFTANRTDTTRNINGRFGIDYELNKHTVIGVLFTGYDNHYSQSENNRSLIKSNASLDTSVQQHNKEMNHWYNYTGNINLQHEFKKAGKLLLNLDYIYYKNNQPVNYHSAYYYNGDNFLYDQYFKSGKQTPIHLWVAAADYTKKINSKLNMEAGLKQTISAFNNDISFERLDETGWNKDNNLSALYKLREDYSAAYASFDMTVNKTTEAKAGLRYEHTNSNLGTADEKDIVDRHYGNLFPSLFISHKLDENSSIDASYSRRITRPTFNDLAPFTYYANANTVLTGNPALQPSLSDNVKAGYTFKKYLVSLSYSFEKNAIASFQPHSDAASNKVVLSAENLVNQKTASLVLSVPVTVAKWWTMQYNINAIWQQVNALYQGAPLKQDQINVTINGSESFTLPKSFSLELSGYYSSPSLNGLLYIKAMGSLDAGIKKKLPKKYGSLTFNATNILNTGVFSMSSSLPEQNIMTTVKLRYTYPMFKLTYTRSFGKDKLKEKRQRSTGAEDETNRVHEQ